MLDCRNGCDDIQHAICILQSLQDNENMRVRMKDIISKFNGIKIPTIGDLIIDQYPYETGDSDE